MVLPVTNFGHAARTYEPRVSLCSKISVWVKNRFRTHPSKWKEELPEDCAFHISAFLQLEEIGRCAAVCSIWKQHFDHPDLWKEQFKIKKMVPPPVDAFPILNEELGKIFDIQTLDIICSYDLLNERYKAEIAKPIGMVFDAADWEAYFRLKVINPISYPTGMRQINLQRCPYWPDKKIGQTHIWMLRPAYITQGIYDEKLSFFALNDFQRYMNFRNSGLAPGIFLFNFFIAYTEPSETACWQLMTKTAIPIDQQLSEEYGLPSLMDASCMMIGMILKFGITQFAFKEDIFSIAVANGGFCKIGGFDAGLRITEITETHDETQAIAMRTITQ